MRRKRLWAVSNNVCDRGREEWQISKRLGKGEDNAKFFSESFQRAWSVGEGLSRKTKGNNALCAARFTRSFCLSWMLIHQRLYYQHGMFVNYDSHSNTEFMNLWNNIEGVSRLLKQLWTPHSNTCSILEFEAPTPSNPVVPTRSPHGPWQELTLIPRPSLPQSSYIHAHFAFPTNRHDLYT